MAVNVQGKQSSIRVELSDPEAEGIYSNLAFISHTTSEFILDFARLLPGSPKAKVHARVVMTPQHARALLGALDSTIKKYEERFGTIHVPDGQSSARPIGFQTQPTPDTPPAPDNLPPAEAQRAREAPLVRHESAGA